MYHGYVQDERYIACEHRDVRRDCVSFARPVIWCAARLCSGWTVFRDWAHGCAARLSQSCTAFHRYSCELNSVLSKLSGAGAGVLPTRTRYEYVPVTSFSTPVSQGPARQYPHPSFSLTVVHLSESTIARLLFYKTDPNYSGRSRLCDRIHCPVNFIS